jgi:hypothetical protein
MSRQRWNELEGTATEARVAIFGGDDRQAERWAHFKGARFFASPKGGRNGELRRLTASLRARSIDLLLILARWNGHSATKQIRRLCRRLGVRVVIMP